MANEPSTLPHHIAILLFDGFEELDAVGQWEVLAYWTRIHPGDGWAVSCMSQDGRPVTAAKGLVLGAQHAIADAPPLQVLTYPGGEGTRVLCATRNTSIGYAPNARPSR